MSWDLPAWLRHGADAATDDAEASSRRTAPGKRTLTAHLQPGADSGARDAAKHDSGVQFLAGVASDEPRSDVALSGEQSFVDSIINGPVERPSGGSRDIDHWLATSASTSLGSERTELEGAFGTRFGQVRLHGDASAAEVVEDLGARAFAKGDHVVLPDTVQGAERTFILAHELAHVVQQRGGSGAETTDTEAAADDAAHAFVSGRRISAQPGAGVAVARYATSSPPAPVQVQAPIGNQNARGPTSGDLTGGRKTAEREFDREAARAGQEQPTITVKPGGTPPHFITSTGQADQMVRGGTSEDPHNIVVDYVPRRFHVVPAIQHDMGLVSTVDELETLWTLYLQDAPQPAPWTRDLVIARLDADPDSVMSVPHCDEDGPADWVLPFQRMRLPKGAAAGQILWGIVSTKGQHDDPGGGVRRQTLITAAFARADDVEPLKWLLRTVTDPALAHEKPKKAGGAKDKAKAKTTDEDEDKGKNENKNKRHALPPGDNAAPVHRGRVQVQGGGVEKSRNWTQAAPRTKADGLADLDSLKQELTRSQLKERDQAFERARRFIETTVYTAPPDLHRTYQNREVVARNGPERVDVEILEGTAFA